jgi:small subunit ribosomal protein S4e
MAKRHLKRLNAPTSWKIKRKGTVFITRSNPGPHPMHLSMPISLVIQNLLGHAHTLRDVKNILNKNTVLVDNRRIKDHRFPVGFMDSLAMPETKECYRVILNRKGMIDLNKLSAEDGKKKICKIIGKTIIKKSKMQINFSDARNMIVDKGSYNVGDSVVIDLESKKITSHLKFENGAKVMLTGGKSIGLIGKVEEIKGEKLIYSDDSGKRLETAKRYAFVIEPGLIGKK